MRSAIDISLVPGEPTRAPELFAGRRNELNHALSELRSGTNRSLVIAGPNGIGKRSLAEQVRLILTRQKLDLLEEHQMWHHQPVGSRVASIPLLIRGERLETAEELAIHLWTAAGSLDVFRELLEVTVASSDSRTLGLSRQIYRQRSNSKRSLLDLDINELGALQRARLLVETLERSASELSVLLCLDLSDLVEAEVDECVDFVKRLSGRSGVRFLLVADNEGARRMIREAGSFLGSLFLEPLSDDDMNLFVHRVTASLNGTCNGQTVVVTDEAISELSALTSGSRPDLWHILGRGSFRSAHSRSRPPRRGVMTHGYRQVLVEALDVTTARDHYLDQLTVSLEPEIVAMQNLPPGAKVLLDELSSQGLEYEISLPDLVEIGDKRRLKNVHLSASALRRRGILNERSIRWITPGLGDYIRFERKK